MTDLLQVLLDMRSDAVAADCNKKFNQVLAAVLDTAGKGELTIKLMISPSKMGLGGAVLEVQASHEIKTKKPESAKRSFSWRRTGRSAATTRPSPRCSRRIRPMS